jgi:multidrug efflux pump subunit AcrB
MPGAAIRNPYFVIVICLIIAVVGGVSIGRMPVDLFPDINIPVVLVATFYNGMPPEQIEADITGRFERFFTLASNIDHIESRSLPGVSLIKIYFQPGADPDSVVTNISNLAMANLRRLPPGTLPPVVMKFDASSLPVCLITLKGDGLNETELRDAAQFAVRNQVANVAGASVPQPFGGRYRQIMVYVDPYKLEAHQLSPMDVTRAVNDSNLILPAGDVRIGPLDYSLYTNSQAENMGEVNSIPLKTVGNAVVRVADVGEAKDAQQIQLSVVRVDGQPSVYLPVLKQGGDTNTIQVVDGVRKAVAALTDVPETLRAEVVFDQSEFVRKAISNLLREGALGLFLTSVMILIFLGSIRATTAVLLSIPLSALATFMLLYFGGGSINSMVLGGLALAFSRLIDNSVVVLENIHRHLEKGEPPAQAAEAGGNEVALPVLAATLTTAVVFFPVTFLYGVSRFLFSALALSVVISLAASFFVATTVVPLFCARFLQAHSGPEADHGASARFQRWFNAGFSRMLDGYTWSVRRAVLRPATTIGAILAAFGCSLLLYPAVQVAFFPRTDAGQFAMNVKLPPGTRLGNTSGSVEAIENLIRRTIPGRELRMIVSNIGVAPGFSSMYTSNSAQHTATIQVSLAEVHTVATDSYVARVRQKLSREMPEVSAYFQSGGLVDAVINLGLPAPIDIQVSGSDLQSVNEIARAISGKTRAIPGVSDVYTPQDLDYPALRLTIDRQRAGILGLTHKEVTQNIITSLTSNQVIAPSYWVDPRTGNDYMLTVQYPENQLKSIADLKAIPLRGANRSMPTRLDAVADVQRIDAPTEVDHYQLRRVMDVYVGLMGEDLGRVADQIGGIISGLELPKGVRVDLRGMVQGMRASFKSFGTGLLLALVLLYLILVAQFRSFVDPALILLAVPTGLSGVLITLVLTGTSLNVMSLMGVVMMSGIVVSNSILILDFAHRLRKDGRTAREAAIEASRTRLRPILMTSLATIIGLLPMALKLGEGSESYAPLARAIIGGLAVSLMFTVYIVPAAYQFVYGRKQASI